MKEKLRECQGDFTVNGVLLLLLVIALLLVSISVLAVANQAIRLHSMTAQLVRFVEIRGQTDSAVYTELERLKQATGMDVTCEISANQIAGTSKIQFGESFTVKLSCDAKLGLGGIVSVPIELNSKVTGRGEQYWP